jgi:DedD protein
MGWFSRSQPQTQSGRRTTPRGGQATEAQVAELRGKARRRLIGALVLVLTAVIFVPMLFDSAPPDQSLPAPVVVPAMPASQAPETQLAASSGSLQQAPQPDTAQLTDVPMPQAPAAPSEAHSPPASEPATAPQPGASTSAGSTAAASANTPASDPAPSKPAPRTGRTDDGSVAIALLEGRTPQKAAPEKGNFILQIAAYGTDKDAQVRRDKLIASGVTNAYVEQAMSNGKPTYRLRVGPFPTRDAAQAAQARLRALGYDNGFISAQ